MERRKTVDGGVSRRYFCRTLAAAALLWPASSAFALPELRPRRFTLANLHTGEELELSCRPGEVCDDAMTRDLNHFLRCPQTGETAQIDTAVVDLLWDVCRSAGAGSRVEIVSGYRSPEYNEYLRRRGRRVARHSLHTQGLAIDFAVPGIKPRRLARLAREFAVGGVGTYSEFVHIDSGPVRYW